MKRKFDIKKVLHTVFKKSRSLSDPQLMHPEREWGIGLVVSLTILILGSALGAYTYFKNQSVDVVTDADEVSGTVYRQSLVKEVLDDMNKRSAKLESLKSKEPAAAPEPVEETPVEVVATSSEPVVETTTISNE